MSRTLTQEQQEIYQRLQNWSQQLQTMQQGYLQMEGRKRELERTLQVLEKQAEEKEIYRTAGQILFKTDVKSTKSELSDELELFEVRLKRSKSQIDDLDKRIKDGDTQLRSMIQV